MQQTVCRLGFVAVSLLVSTGVSATEPGQEIPFKLYRGYTIVTQGSVGRLHKLNFLIDTGAVPSVIDRRIALKLRLAGHEESLSVFDRNVSAQRVTVSDIQLGPVRAESLSVLVRDLSFIEAEMGVRIDAMIGLDFLNRSSFRIDYEHKTITFGTPPPSGSTVPFMPGLPYPIVEFQAQGYRLHLLVDTGAKDLILFEPRIRGHLPGLRTVSYKTSANMGGAVSLQQVELAESRLGGKDLGTLHASVLEVAAGSVPGFDGLLGVASLGAKSLSFDFQRHLISWEQ